MGHSYSFHKIKKSQGKGVLYNSIDQVMYLILFLLEWDSLEDRVCTDHLHRGEFHPECFGEKEWRGKENQKADNMTQYNFYWKWAAKFTHKEWIIAE